MATRVASKLGAEPADGVAAAKLSARDLDWLMVMVATASVQLLLWFILAARGYAAPPLVKYYSVLGCTILAVVGLAALLWNLLGMARMGEPRPIERTLRLVRENASRILASVAAVEVFTMGSAAFSALKTALPAVSPFWTDFYLAPAEQQFLGEAPWELTHRLFGWATPAIDLVYASWLAVQAAAFYGLIIMKPSRLKSHALKAHSLAWLILGVGGAYALSSAGPIFYDRLFSSTSFSGLSQTLRDAPVATRTSEMLWRAYAYHTNEVASGISAMPSMHVAMACWLALTIRGLFPRFQWVGWIYFGLIWLGSIHLGWHYASDGLVGAAGVLLVWHLARNLRFPGRTNFAAEASSFGSSTRYSRGLR